MTFLNLLWHFHQPWYPAPDSSRIDTGIITFRFLYNYLPMVFFLEESDVHVSCNFTPTLLLQIQGIAEGSIMDTFQALLTGESQDDVAKVRFFWNEIPPSVRGRHKVACRLAEKLAGDKLNEKELSDLKVWLHLICFHRTLLNRFRDIAELQIKGVGFSQQDKQVISSIEKEYFSSFIPRLKSMQDSGRVEISTTPFFHPILPLVCNLDTAVQTETKLKIPRLNFSYPDDARKHLELARSAYRKFFGCEPRGMWPAEGAVSDQTLDILAENDLQWTATDQEIILRISGRDFAGCCERLYLWKDKMAIFFRNREFSDRIGFTYQKWDEKLAAEDLVARAVSFGEKTPRILAVILDGENPWEWYKDEGAFFVPELYRRISTNPAVKALTFSETCRLDFRREHLSHIPAGSWMGLNFDNWIGHQDANRGWQLLADARRAFETMHTADKPIQKLHELLLMAENSDFFWWMSLPADLLTKQKFYSSFKAILTHFYRVAGLEIPPEIESFNAVAWSSPQPKRSIHPILDGVRSNYFEWAGAAEIEPDKLWLTFQPVELPVTRLFYGCDVENLYLRIDFAGYFSGTVRLEFEGNQQIFELPLKGTRFKQPDAAYDECLEWKIPWQNTGKAEGDTVSFRLILTPEGEDSFIMLPPYGFFSFKRLNAEDDWQV
jgi:alpha-amylase/alpha-mannosidase (GH57 family)